MTDGINFTAPVIAPDRMLRSNTCHVLLIFMKVSLTLRPVALPAVPYVLSVLRAAFVGSLRSCFFFFKSRLILLSLWAMRHPAGLRATNCYSWLKTYVFPIVCHVMQQRCKKSPWLDLPVSVSISSVSEDITRSSCFFIYPLRRVIASIATACKILYGPK